MFAGKNPGIQDEDEEDLKRQISTNEMKADAMMDGTSGEGVDAEAAARQSAMDGMLESVGAEPEEAHSVDGMENLFSMPRKRPKSKSGGGGGGGMGGMMGGGGGGGASSILGMFGMGG